MYISREFIHTDTHTQQTTHVSDMCNPSVSPSATNKQPTKGPGGGAHDLM